MKPDKFLCCRILIAFLALTVHNTIVVYSVLRFTNQQKRAGYVIHV